MPLSQFFGNLFRAFPRCATYLDNFVSVSTYIIRNIVEFKLVKLDANVAESVNQLSRHCIETFNKPIFNRFI